VKSFCCRAVRGVAPPNFFRPFLAHSFILHPFVGNVPFRNYQEGARNSYPQNQPGDPRGDDRNNPVAGEFLHESVQEARLRGLWRERRAAGAYFSAQCRASRLAAVRKPETHAVVSPEKSSCVLEKLRKHSVKAYLEQSY